MAFCDLRGNMDLAEAFQHVFKFALETCPEDMEFFNQRIDNSVLSTADNIINNEFERVTYTEAIALLEKPTFEYPVRWGLDLRRNTSATWLSSCLKARLQITQLKSKPFICA